MKAAEPRSSGPMTAQTGPTGMIMDRIGRSWRSAMRDVFLIVVSILIAFGLDAWWSGRMALDLRDWAGERGLLTSVLALWGFPSLSAEATPHEILLELTMSGRGLLAAQLLSLNGLHMELQDVDRRLSSILELLAAELGED